MVGDSERGFIAEEFTDKLARAGTLYIPAAGYAPQQKGQVERKIQSFKSIVKKAVIHQGINTSQEMKICGIEAAAALNARPGATGVSPGMLLFGQRLKIYGELYADGEPTYHHLEGHDATSELGRRLAIRLVIRKSRLENNRL